MLAVVAAARALQLFLLDLWETVFLKSRNYFRESHFPSYYVQRDLLYWLIGVQLRFLQFGHVFTDLGGGGGTLL